MTKCYHTYRNIITQYTILSIVRSDFFMFQVDIERKKAHFQAMKRLENKPKIPNNSDFLQFGYTLKLIRKLNGITQETLAAEANTYKPRISEYEAGKRIPNLQTVEALYIALKNLNVNEKEIYKLENAYYTTLEHSNKTRVAAAYKVKLK